MRHKPISLLQVGGHQPYARAGGQTPGPALTAMKQGTTLHGYHPAAAQRAAQVASRRRGARPRSLLDMLLQ